MPNPQAQIFLADQRGCSQTDVFRSFHTFNFGQYIAEGREPFGSLILFNDDTLAAGASQTIQIEANTDVVIIPVVGGLAFASDVARGFLEPGQVQVLSLTAGMTYQLSNPYETELINVLQIWLTNTSLDVSPAAAQTVFDLSQKNMLLPLFSIRGAASALGFIGQYNGRAAGVYQPVESENADANRGVYAFVLAGAFEVQNRLLHNRDGLALWNRAGEIVEFEALSNNAMILLFDIYGVETHS